jgi:hypothetical protein
MNIDTGEIREFSQDEKIPPRFVALSGREATYLRGREQKNRILALKRLRKQAIRAAKRAKGGRLTDGEMKAALANLN